MTHCYICGRPYPEIHHIFSGTADRKKSDEDGCIVPLCLTHHRLGEDAAHRNRTTNLRLKQIAETEWIEQRVREWGLSEETAKRNFIIRYGKSWL